jgi:hypothetical protein
MRVLAAEVVPAATAAPATTAMTAMTAAGSGEMVPPAAMAVMAAEAATVGPAVLTEKVVLPATVVRVEPAATALTTRHMPAARAVSVGPVVPAVSPVRLVWVAPVELRVVVVPAGPAVPAVEAATLPVLARPAMEEPAARVVQPTPESVVSAAREERAETPSPRGKPLAQAVMAVQVGQPRPVPVGLVGPVAPVVSAMPVSVARTIRPATQETARPVVGVVTAERPISGALTVMGAGAVTAAVAVTVPIAFRGLVTVVTAETAARLVRVARPALAGPAAPVATQATEAGVGTAATVALDLMVPAAA